MDLEPIERIAYSTMVGRTEDPNREPGWLYYHCQRTGKIALWLAEQLQLNGKIDLDVIYVGALLHDIAKGTNSHNEAGANLVRKALVPHCSPIEIDGICEIIRDHNQRGVPDQPISVKIVQDADGSHWPDRPVAYVLLPPAELEKALRLLPEKLRRAMELAAERIRRFHALQPLPNWETTALGGRLGQRVTPIERVGVYVPGGTAPLPSSLLMSVIPARVAGVKEIIVCTPPNGCTHLHPHPAILAAASLCQVEAVYPIGGAQAIAAMAYGTETVPKVDKIVGAGNLFVTLAKQQVFGIVGLDGLAGPTETLIIADDHANPAWVAATPPG